MGLENQSWLLVILMPMTAFLYASVGHGGASSYITLLSLFGFLPGEIRTTALILNILVSGFAFLFFRKKCEFPLGLFLSLAAFSVPASFIGGTILLDVHLYQKILGVLLIFPVLRLLNVFPVNETPVIKRKLWMAPLLGLLIGIVSGMIGIGGGIILSPLLLMSGWCNVKETAAVSALFIFVNSISGLAGTGSVFMATSEIIYLLLFVTLCGGIAGAYFGSHHFRIPVLRYILGIVLMIASAKFLLT
jgi:hypothetical protein